MIRYRQLTEEELAAINQPLSDKPVKRSTLKKQHHDRQKDPPPRKVAGRHAARKPKDA